MEDFKIKTESRKPNYQSAFTYPRKGASLIMGALILASLSNCIPIGGDMVTAGIPAGEPAYLQFYSKSNFNSVMNQLFNEYNITMENDYTLVNLDGGSPDTQIDFRADGYNSEKHIAFEWIAAPNYQEEEDYEQLTDTEMELISSNYYDNTYLVIVDSVYTKVAISNFDQLLADYPEITNQQVTNS